MKLTTPAGARISKMLIVPSAYRTAISLMPRRRTDPRPWRPGSEMPDVRVAWTAPVVGLRTVTAVLLSVTREREPAKLPSVDGDLCCAAGISRSCRQNTCAIVGEEGRATAGGAVIGHGRVEHGRQCRGRYVTGVIIQDHAGGAVPAE